MTDLHLALCCIETRKKQEYTYKSRKSKIRSTEIVASQVLRFLKH